MKLLKICCFDHSICAYTGVIGTFFTSKKSLQAMAQRSKNTINIHIHKGSTFASLGLILETSQRSFAKVKPLLLLTSFLNIEVNTKLFSTILY